MGFQTKPNELRGFHCIEPSWLNLLQIKHAHIVDGRRKGLPQSPLITRRRFIHLATRCDNSESPRYRHGRWFTPQTRSHFSSMGKPKAHIQLNYAERRWGIPSLLLSLHRSLARFSPMAQFMWRVCSPLAVHAGTDPWRVRTEHREEVTNHVKQRFPFFLQLLRRSRSDIR